MFQIVLLVVIIIVAVASFFYLFHNTPSRPSPKPSGRISPQRKTSQEKVAKIVEKKTVQKKEAKFVTDSTYGDIVIPKVKEAETEIFRRYRDKAVEAAPSAQSKEKVKQEKLMPTKKQIERNLQEGFVLVSKKAAAPMSQEQRQDRKEARKKEEDAQKLKDEEARRRYKEQLESRITKPVVFQKEVSIDTLKKIIEDKKATKMADYEKRIKVGGGSVKTFIAPLKSDDQPKIWGATLPIYQPTDEGANLESGEPVDEPQEDPDYPKLQF